MYARLSADDRRVVDGAMEYANAGEYENAIAAFVIGRQKRDYGNSEQLLFARMVLEEHRDSPVQFREGLLGFPWRR
ncbi:MAG: hypothetical protein ACRERD_34995 [Candidatus Binatia bacterium]